MGFTWTNIQCYLYDTKTSNMRYLVKKLFFGDNEFGNTSKDNGSVIYKQNLHNWQAILRDEEKKRDQSEVQHEHHVGSGYIIYRPEQAHGELTFLLLKHSHASPTPYKSGTITKMSLENQQYPYSTGLRNLEEHLSIHHTNLKQANGCFLYNDEYEKDGTIHHEKSYMYMAELLNNNEIALSMKYECFKWATITEINKLCTPTVANMYKRAHAYIMNSPLWTLTDDSTASDITESDFEDYAETKLHDSLHKAIKTDPAQTTPTRTFYQDLTSSRKCKICSMPSICKQEKCKIYPPHFARHHEPCFADRCCKDKYDLGMCENIGRTYFQHLGENQLILTVIPVTEHTTLILIGASFANGKGLKEFLTMMERLSKVARNTTRIDSVHIDNQLENKEHIDRFDAILLRYGQPPAEHIKIYEHRPIYLNVKTLCEKLREHELVQQQSQHLTLQTMAFIRAMWTFTSPDNPIYNQFPILILYQNTQNGEDTSHILNMFSRI